MNELNLSDTDKEILLKYLLNEKYLSEFITVGGLRRHRFGYDFETWVKKILIQSM